MTQVSCQSGKTLCKHYETYLSSSFVVVVFLNFWLNPAVSRTFDASTLEINTVFSEQYLSREIAIGYSFIVFDLTCRESHQLTPWTARPSVVGHQLAVDRSIPCHCLDFF